MSYFPTIGQAVYGTDGDKWLLPAKHLDLSRPDNRSNLLVCHTFDCLLDSGRWQVGDETIIGRISHFYIVYDERENDNDYLTYNVYAVVRVPPIECHERRKKDEFIGDVYGKLTRCGIDIFKNRLRGSYCNINCVAVYLGHADFNRKRSRSLPPLHDCGYEVMPEVHRRNFDCTLIVPSENTSLLLTRKAQRLKANPEIGRGCVVKLPSVLHDMELNVIDAYDDVLVVSPVPQQDYSVPVSLDDKEVGKAPRQFLNKLVLNGKRYDLTRKRLDVVAEPKIGWTTVRILF